MGNSHLVRDQNWFFKVNFKSAPNYSNLLYELCTKLPKVTQMNFQVKLNFFEVIRKTRTQHYFHEIHYQSNVFIKKSY